MMRRIVLAFMLLLGLSRQARAQGWVTVNVGSQQYMQVNPGDVIAVPIVLDMSFGNGGAVGYMNGQMLWNPAALTLDSIAATSFGGVEFDLTNQSAGSAQYWLYGYSAVTTTQDVGTAYFTASNAQGGSRVQLLVTMASNNVGSLALGRVLTRNADVCVAPTGVWGDANGSGLVDIIDAQQIARFSIGLSVAYGLALRQRGDVNADGVVNILDAQQIARFAVSLPASARVNTNLFTPPAASSLVVDRPSFNLTNGLQVLLAATPLSAAGQSMIGCHQVTWATSDALVATVNSAGLVRGVSGGTATITATLGALTAQSTINVIVPDTTVAIASLRNITADTVTAVDGAWMLGGLLADEWKSSDTFAQRNDIDQRTVSDYDTQVATTMRAMYKARSDARGALPKLYSSGAPLVHAARMQFIMGYVELLFAENFCNGVYLNDASTGLVLNGPSVSNASLYNLAIAHFDTAIGFASATDPFTTSVNYLARIGKGRALLALGQSGNAAATVSFVPTSFIDNSAVARGGSNKIWSYNASQKRYTVGDTAGAVSGTLAFATAGDFRLPVSSTGVGFDGATAHRTQATYVQATIAPIFTGVDARLIEAENFLRIGNTAAMVSTLNALRAAPQTIGAITTSPQQPLSSPPSQAAAQAMLYSEKAFWTFGRGQRLADARRRMRLDGALESAVFPNGLFHKGGTFGSIINLPANTDEEGNSVSLVCTDRNP